MIYIIRVVKARKMKWVGHVAHREMATITEKKSMINEVRR
jgi:hypothetical protein